MSQPDLTCSLWSPDGHLHPHPRDLAIPDWEGLSATPENYQALLMELKQVCSLDQARAGRIYHLEQALDQALACLSELRLQVQDQSVLETQLAKTEEFAGVQQQAIARLKLQLCQQQQTLEDQGVEIRNHQTRLTQLEMHLEQANSSLEKQKEVAITLRQTKTLISERSAAIASLQKELAIAQIKVEELETQVAKQITLQARWQQNCQELELERDRYHTRTKALEQEAAEMQEQIFQQARQTSEYEAAVQHWKDRYLASQRQMTQLKVLLEALSQEPTSDTVSSSPALADLLAAIQLVTPPDHPDADPPLALPSPRFNPLDLPDFLIRRCSYRTR